MSDIPKPGEFGYYDAGKGVFHIDADHDAGAIRG